MTASREREGEHPQFIEQEKVGIYDRVISRERGGGGGKQCRPPSPRKMQPKQNEGKHAQFGTKWRLILQCAGEIYVDGVMRVKLLDCKQGLTNKYNLALHLFLTIPVISPSTQ